MLTLTQTQQWGQRGLSNSTFSFFLNVFGHGKRTGERDGVGLRLCIYESHPSQLQDSVLVGVDLDAATLSLTAYSTPFPLLNPFQLDRFWLLLFLFLDQTLFVCVGLVELPESIAVLDVNLEDEEDNRREEAGHGHHAEGLAGAEVVVHVAAHQAARALACVGDIGAVCQA